MIWGDCCLMELLFILSTKNNQVTANIPPPPNHYTTFLLCLKSLESQYSCSGSASCHKALVISDCTYLTIYKKSI